jgi:hypothetical protein
MDLLPGEAELLTDRCADCRHLAVLHYEDLRYDQFGCEVTGCECRGLPGRRPA